MIIAQFNVISYDQNTEFLHKIQNVLDDQNFIQLQTYY